MKLASNEKIEMRLIYDAYSKNKNQNYVHILKNILNKISHLDEIFKYTNFVTLFEKLIILMSPIRVFN